MYLPGNVTAKDRAEIWEALVSIRIRAGDLPGAHRAEQMARENRELVDWKPGSRGKV